MTLDAAIAAAHHDLDLFRMAVAVYRFRAWPEGVYGTRLVAKLPIDALIVTRFDPPEAAPEPAAAAFGGDPQGSLF